MVVNQAIRRNEAKLSVVADKFGKLSKLPNARTLLHKPGMELDVLNALCHTLIEEGLAKTDGLDGLDELKSALKDFSAETVAQAVGAEAEAIKAAAKELVGAEKAAIMVAYGLPYTAYSKEIAIAAANLALLTGIAGREGSGLYLCGEKPTVRGLLISA